MALLDVTPESWIKDLQLCQALLKDSFDSVPLLNANNLEDLKDGRLVKFYGMVQDIFSPEYYMEKYEVIDESSNEKQLRNGKYTDILHCSDGEVINHQCENNVTSERITAVVISVPGLNDWVLNYQTEKFSIKNRDTMEISTTSSKRPLDADTPVDNSEQNHQTTQNKRSCNINPPSSNSSASLVSHEHLLNFPIPNSVGKICHAKVYENFDAIKLNDVIEMVGFLSVDSALIESNGNTDDGDSIMEIQTHNPPPSLVPRIHCVAWKKMEHDNYLIDNCGSSVESEQFLHLKNELHLVLTQLFFGDPVAAEYFLYHLISKTYYAAGEMALGKFALNISHIPVVQIPEYGRRLYEFIELLLPKSHYLPMTLKNMNELAFIPKKDYECNRLTSGILQLSNNTHLVLDETKLEPGQLNESGVRAITAIANTIKWQKVSYDFNYYPMEFVCDIPFLILSEGKSLLQSDFHVVLKPEETCITIFDETVAAAKHFLNVNLLNKLRIYLTLSRFAQYHIDDNTVAELIPNDFARMRQEGQTNVEDLHNLLVLARLVCLSEGKITLDCDCWKRACELESERKKRLC